MSKPKTRRTPDTRRTRKAAVKRSKPAQAKVAPVTPAAPAPSASALDAATQTFTAREFAALFDVSPDTVSRWCAGGMPHEQPGKANAGFRISLAAACPWVVKYAQEAPPESQRERLSREQADKFALENAVRRGELCDAVQVGIVLQRFVQTFWAQAKTIKKRCIHEFAGLTDHIRIGERFDEEFANAGEAMAAVTGDLAAACERAAQDAAALDARTAAAA